MRDVKAEVDLYVDRVAAGDTNTQSLLWDAAAYTAAQNALNRCDTNKGGRPADVVNRYNNANSAWYEISFQAKHLLHPLKRQRRTMVQRLGSAHGRGIR
jgi:hypothetical protein